MPAELRRLRRENQALRAENARLRKRVTDLEALVERLMARIEILEKQTGAGPSAEPLRYAPPEEPAGKRRRRRPRHPGTSWQVPGEIDEVVELPLAACPDCGGELTEWRDAQDHVVVDLPEIRPVVRNFRHQRGYCRQCQKTVRSPRAADEPPRGHFGLRLLALIADLKTRAGVTYPKIARILKGFGVDLPRSTLSQAVQRVAEWLAPVHAALIEEVRASPLTHADETSWPVNGKNGWTWVFTNPETTLYVTEPTRSADVPTAVLGDDYPGTLVVDFYSAYQGVAREHQYCWSHLLRESRAVAAEGDPVAVRLRDSLAGIFREAKRVAERNRDTRCARVRDRRIAEVERRLSDLRKGSSNNPDVERLKNRLARHQGALLTFLHRPGVEPTNNRAEREIRPAVIVRKTSGGSRSWNGARAHAVIASCQRTLEKRGRDFLEGLRLIVGATTTRETLHSVLPT